MSQLDPRLPLLFVSALLAAACASTASQGGEGELCFSNGTCDMGLSCVNQLCETGDGGVDGGTDGGTEFDKCLGGVGEPDLEPCLDSITDTSSSTCVAEPAALQMAATDFRTCSNTSCGTQCSEL